MGAALIAGSQLSSIGSLDICARWSVACIRLPLAMVGVGLGLFGVAWGISAGVGVLVYQNKPLSGLQREWVKGRKSSVYRFFTSDPVLLQGFADFDNMAAEEAAAYAAYDEVEKRIRDATTDEEKKALQLLLRDADEHLADVLERSEAVVNLANQIYLADFFSQTTLKRLLYAAVITAVGIGLFAWAANPPQ